MSERNHKATNAAQLAQQIASKLPPSSENRSAPRAEPPRAAASSTPARINEDAVDDLWVVMARAFGHRWVSQFGEADDGTWYGLLHDLTPEQLAAGVRRLAQRGEILGTPPEQLGWPPNALEFRALCTWAPPAPRQSEQLQRAAFMLDKPRASYDTARPYLQRMREILRRPAGAGNNNSDT